MTHSHVIMSPVTPIYFGSYHYYWGGHYVSDYQRPQKCKYEITDEDQELRNVTFSNGTKPTTLAFGCKSSEGCCGLECCNDSSPWIWIICIIIAVGIFLLCCFWCHKNANCNWESDTSYATAIPVVTTTTTTHSYTVPSAPPPPPGFQPQQTPHGLPVYSQPPAYRTYEQPSMYDVRPVSSSQVHTHYKC
uniref:CX domain-containing protein n=1 Tax=Caenorhabditis japonica TaxID=281687 RepID=A0A8R1DGY8_CAEJA